MSRPTEPYVTDRFYDFFARARSDQRQAILDSLRAMDRAATKNESEAARAANTTEEGALQQ